MTATCLIQIPSIHPGRTGFLSAAATSGTARLHLHPEYQFATPDRAALLSIGALRRLEVGPGEVALIPPGILHREVGAAGSLWRILHLSPSALINLDFCRDLPFRTGVIHEPDLARWLADLVDAAVKDPMSAADLLPDVREWQRDLAQGVQAQRIAS